MSNNHPDDSQLDSNDPVWRLLAHSPMPQPDAWFTVRTLARCRQAGLGMEKAHASFGQAWRWVFGSGIGLCLAISLLVAQIHSESAMHSKQKKVQEAFEIVASLGSDSDSSLNNTTSSWQDTSL